MPLFVLSYLRMIVWPIPYVEFGPPEYEYNSLSPNPASMPTAPKISSTTPNAVSNPDGEELILSLNK